MNTVSMFNLCSLLTHASAWPLMHGGFIMNSIRLFIHNECMKRVQWSMFNPLITPHACRFNRDFLHKVILSYATDRLMDARLGGLAQGHAFNIPIFAWHRRWGTRTVCEHYCVSCTIVPGIFCTNIVMYCKIWCNIFYWKGHLLF